MPESWRVFLRECLTSLDGPPAPAHRLVTTAWIILVPVTLFVLLPTGLHHLLAPSLAWQPEVAWWLALAWWVQALAVVVACAVVIAVRGRGTAGRVLSYVAVFGLIGTNEISMLALGSLTSWGGLYVVALVVGYRVFLDYRLGFVPAALGVVLLNLGVLLEWSGGMHLAPYSRDPVVHPLYDDGAFALAVVLVADVSILLTFFLVNYGMNQSLKLHRYITESVLQRYLPPALVARAAEGALRLDDPPERRVVTVLFTDLVGFTTMSERLGAEVVGDLLNRYLCAMADLAHAHGATIDKFMGDAVMLVYGAPEVMAPEEQARRCVALAREMVAAARGLDGVLSLRLRAGINTGEVLVGNFGSLNRSDYTVIGPVVNVAARLESASKPGRILLSAATATLLGDEVPLDRAGRLQLKGVEQPIEAFFVAEITTTPTSAQGR